MLSLAGRATRRGYIAVNIVLGIGPAIVGEALGTRMKAAFEQVPDAVGVIAALLLFIGIVWVVWVLMLVLPVRRLHDMNLSGWHYVLIVLLGVVPYVGPLVGFVWLVCVRGTKGGNRFGADPRGPSDRTVADVFEGPPAVPGAG